MSAENGKLEIAKIDHSIISSLVLNGDVSKMNDQQKTEYFQGFCDSLGLNPLTQPFKIINLQGKLTLYATKDATEQLRRIYGVSVTDLKTEKIDGIFKVTAHVQDSSGRKDVSTGAVAVLYPAKTKTQNGWIDHPRAGRQLEGDDLANAIMKAETKAKRRATLSICGLGMLDESEIETIKDAGEIVEVKAEEVKSFATIEDVEYQTREELLKDYTKMLQEPYFNQEEIKRYMYKSNWSDQGFIDAFKSIREKHESRAEQLAQEHFADYKEVEDAN